MKYVGTVRSTRSGEVLDGWEEKCLLTRSYRQNTGNYIVKCYIGFCIPTCMEMDLEKKNAGMVMTAMGQCLAYSGGIRSTYLTSLFRYCSAVSFILTRTIDDSYLGV